MITISTLLRIFVFTLVFLKVTSAEDCTQLTVDIDTVRTIQSHPDRNQGLNYPVDFDKCWNLRASDHDFVVKVAVTEFDLQQSDSKGHCLDWMKIYNLPTGRDRQQVGEFCGSVLPEDIVSTHSTLIVEFHSDHNVTKSGYKLEYSSLKQSGGISTKTIVAIVIVSYIVIFCLVVVFVSCYVKTRKPVSPCDADNTTTTSPHVHHSIPSKTAKYRANVTQFYHECTLSSSQLEHGPPYYTKEERDLKRKSLPRLYIPDRVISAAAFNRVLERQMKKDSSEDQQQRQKLKVKKIRKRKVETVRLWPDWVYEENEMKQGVTLGTGSKGVKDESLRLESVTADKFPKKTFTRTISLSEEKKATSVNDKKGMDKSREKSSAEVKQVEKVRNTTGTVEQLAIESVVDTGDSRSGYKTFVTQVSLEAQKKT